MARFQVCGMCMIIGAEFRFKTRGNIICLWLIFRDHFTCVRFLNPAAYQSNFLELNFPEEPFRQNLVKSYFTNCRAYVSINFCHSKLPLKVALLSSFRRNLSNLRGLKPGDIITFIASNSCRGSLKAMSMSPVSLKL